MNREVSKYYQKGRIYMKNGEYKNAQLMFEKARAIFLSDSK